MRSTHSGDMDGARCSHGLVANWLFWIRRTILSGRARFCAFVLAICALTVAPGAAQDPRVILPSDTTIDAGSEGYRIRLYASEPAEVTVSVLGPGGGELERIYTGPINDVVDIDWSVRDPATDRPIEGSVVLEVVSTSPTSVSRRIRIPLSITVERVDTVAHPAPPDTIAILAQPESLLPARLALAAGIVSGAAAIALPSVIARDGRGAPIRFVIGGALGAGGVIAYLSRSEPQPDVNAILENARLRAAWREQVERVMAENVTSGVQLRIQSGEASIEPGGPW